MSSNPHAARIAAIERHLNAYQREGSALDQEARQIAVLKKRVERPAMVVYFGEVDSGGRFSVPRDYSDVGDVVFHRDPTRLASVPDFAPRTARANEIAGPGLRACLAMWLAEWETDLRRRRDAWAARDPIAEATALPVPEAATVPAPPLA